MSYRDLPLNERMRLASEYAVLLVADMKTEDEITAILQHDFALTAKEARQAYDNMRTTHKSIYKATANNNLLKALGGIVVGSLICITYYFMGKEMGSWGLSLIMIAIAGLSTLLGLIGLGRILAERFLYLPRMRGFKMPKPEKAIRQAWGAAFSISLFMTGFTGYIYVGEEGIVNENETTTLRDLIVTEPVKKLYTGRRNRNYYYLFKFRGHNNEFWFRDYYFNYGKKSVGNDLYNFVFGDTVTIQIANSDLPAFENQYNTDQIDILNLSTSQGFYIDHAYRNRIIDQSNKNQFIFMLQIFIACVVGAACWYLWHFIARLVFISSNR